jgi:hypothetical protein
MSTERVQESLNRSSKMTMLYEFRDKIFLEYKKYWFVWEAAWEEFRPIQGVAWNGETFQIQDDLYCSDPTSELYGYAFPRMKQLCELLKEKYNDTPVKVSSLPIGTEWFRDRFVGLTPCAPRDGKSWKRMVQNKQRTCRKAPRGKKLTRRNPL